MSERLLAHLATLGVTNADWAVLLGSGLAPLEEPLAPKLVARYADLPDWFVPTVHGHGGRLLLSELNGQRILIFEGRNHFYEGNDLEPMRKFADLVSALAIPRALITCAVGGIAQRLSAGEVFLIDDTINLLFGPRQKPSGEHRGRMFDRGLRMRFQETARELGIPVKRGVLTTLSGPTYETPAEVEFLTRIGTEVVSMSTVYESALLAERGLEVLGVACVSNVHGPGIGVVDHSSVVTAVTSAAREVGRIFHKMVENQSRV